MMEIFIVFQLNIFDQLNLLVYQLHFFRDYIIFQTQMIYNIYPLRRKRTFYHHLSKILNFIYWTFRNILRELLEIPTENSSHIILHYFLLLESFSTIHKFKDKKSFVLINKSSSILSKKNRIYQKRLKIDSGFLTQINNFNNFKSPQKGLQK